MDRPKAPADLVPASDVPLVELPDTPAARALVERLIEASAAVAVGASA